MRHRYSFPLSSTEAGALDHKQGKVLPVFSAQILLLHPFCEGGGETSCFPYLKQTHAVFQKQFQLLQEMREFDF